MSSDGIMNHQQLIRGLIKLCRDKASGTVFLNIEDGNSARLVLNQGVICWAAFKELRGESAIDAISGIGAARFKFNPILKLAIGEQQLPSTPEVLKRLNTYTDDEQEELVPTVTDVVSPLHPVDTGTGGDRPFKLDQVRTVLERESMEYLGPMARLLCGDYLKSLPANLSLVQVRHVMNALLQDINDEQKGQRFLERVRNALGIH
jgi:hypothetical protein